MHEVQLKLKVIKKHQKFKNPTTVCFLLMDSLGRVEAKQKQNGNISQHINHVTPPVVPIFVEH